MLNAIAKPFGMLLLWLNGLVGNYGIAILLFAIIVKLILLPFQMKSKKSMMRTASLAPRLKELEKRHEGNQRKYQEEVSKLYKEEGVSPMSGCLWSLIPFPILIALYQAIRYPLTVMMGVGSDLVNEGGAIYAKLAEMGFDFTQTNAAYIQLKESQFISEHFEDFAGLSDRLVQLDYSFLGLNLGNQPKVFFWNTEGFTWSDVGVWLPILGLFLIPLISGFLSWLNMKLSQKFSPAASAPSTQAGQQSAQQMKMMNWMMPAVSVYIGFIMPAALGIYWIYQSVLSIIQEAVLNAHYGKIIAKETAAREEKYRLREAEIERKRQETERLKTEGVTTVNNNTSKKKMQARQKAELDELKAAAIREERTARRAKLGIVEEEKPASQVGNRRYARGRAYVPDRFTNPEGAAEATAAAAAESESRGSIDETVGEAAPETVGETAPETVGEAPEETADAGEETPEEESRDEDEDEDEDEDGTNDQEED